MTGRVLFTGVLTGLLCTGGAFADSYGSRHWSRPGHGAHNYHYVTRGPAVGWSVGYSAYNPYYSYNYNYNPYWNGSTVWVGPSGYYQAGWSYPRSGYSMHRIHPVYRWHR